MAFASSAIRGLKQGADGVPVADICRRAAISPATYCNWKKRYEGLGPLAMRRLKQLGDENTKLRKLVADDPPAPDAARTRGRMSAAPASTSSHACSSLPA